MDFEWDEVKNEANLLKHGIDFEDAIGMFSRPVLEKVDSRREYGEIRVIAIGLVDQRELVVVYTIRGQTHRIISARRAGSDERRAYHQSQAQ